MTVCASVAGSPMVRAEQRRRATHHRSESAFIKDVLERRSLHSDTVKFLRMIRPVGIAEAPGVGCQGIRLDREP